jgi:polysaccharide pyruvyl transferase CsaB
LSDKLSAVNQRKLVVVSGYYGFDNLGDEAILEELVSELKKLVHPDEIVVLSNNPDKTASLYGVQALDRWRLPALLSVLGRARLFISGGGGLLQDATGPRSVFFYGGQILAARLAGVPVLVYAQGIGPLKRPTSKIMAACALKLANQVTVRDQGSLHMAESWGASPELTADPVWSLSASALPDSFKLLPGEANLTSKIQLVGVSLRRHPLINSHHLSLLARIFQKGFAASTTFVMLPFQKTEDSEVLAKLIEECNKLNVQACMLKAEEIVKPSQWLKLMESFDLIVGMRLHALLMAIKAGKPIIGLPYDPKVTILCETFQQPMLDLTKEPEDGLETAWFNTIEHALANRIELANQARNTTVLMQEKSCKNFEILARILKS